MIAASIAARDCGLFFQHVEPSTSATCPQMS
jgi:hypothetical protein